MLDLVITGTKRYLEKIQAQKDYESSKKLERSLRKKYRKIFEDPKNTIDVSLSKNIFRLNLYFTDKDNIEKILDILEKQYG